MGYRYIGSKARIADEIIEYISETTTFSENAYFIDAFSGTGCVAEKAALCGWPVYINDMMKSAVVMSEARLLSNSDVLFNEFGGYPAAIDILNNLPGKEGFIWREYSPASLMYQENERKYFTEENAKKIDAISAQIHSWKNEGKISQSEWTLLLSDLIRAVNDVANIAGTYGCFLSRWTTQSKDALLLNVSPLKNHPLVFKTTNIDVFEVDSNQQDIVYLDPPYTKRQYASYYHILETIVCDDHPIVAGVSGLRPWKEKASVFCYKTKALKALTELIVQQKAKRVILSYSDEGHVQLNDLTAALTPYGEVKVIELKTIGRYRPNKTAVGNKAEVKEYLIDFRRKQEINE